jgi:c-di-GMP-binding flagellar brake protein YcgR
MPQPAMTPTAFIKRTTALNLPANAYCHSRIEICKVLHKLLHENSAIFAWVGDEQLFVSRILRIDESADSLVMEYGEDKSRNNLLFDQPFLIFKANYQAAHLVFKLTCPANILFNEKPALQFSLPQSLIFSQHRQNQRKPIPPHFPLNCIARNKGTLLLVSIVDISLNGMGGIISDMDSKLTVGTILSGCRVIYPNGNPIKVDLVVRNIQTITDSNGKLCKRAGVSFLQRPDEIQALINHFIYDLDPLKMSP